MSVERRVALITGGGKGIGKAIALCFARNGYAVAVNDYPAVPDGLSAEIAESGGVMFEAPGDVSLYADAQRVVKSVKEAFGRVDVLVNNAGITRDNLIIRMSEDEFDRVIAVNLKGAFNMVRHTAPLMLKQKTGAIVNMASVAGLGGNMGQINYAASKAGLIGLTKATARELASRGITCNAVAPGGVDTDMTRALPDEVRASMLSGIPLGRFADVNEIAETVFFLANNRYITGETMCIDGGMMLL